MLMESRQEFKASRSFRKQTYLFDQQIWGFNSSAFFCGVRVSTPAGMVVKVLISWTRMSLCPTYLRTFVRSPRFFTCKSRVLLRFPGCLEACLAFGRSLPWKRSSMKSTPVDPMRSVSRRPEPRWIPSARIKEPRGTVNFYHLDETWEIACGKGAHSGRTVVQIQCWGPLSSWVVP